jgi:hypothetical protein
MSAIDGIIHGLNVAVDRVAEGTSTVSAVEQETDQALEQAVALGMNAAIEGFGRLKQEVEPVQAMMVAGDQAVQDSVNLAAAVDAYDLHNSQRPEDDQLHALATSFSEMESWAEFDQLTAYTFLKALADQRSLEGTLSAEVVTRIVFVMGAWLLASFGAEDRDWYTYLDEILDALESLSG